MVARAQADLPNFHCAGLAHLVVGRDRDHLTAGQSEIGFGGAEDAAPGTSTTVVHQFDSAVAGARPRVSPTVDELAAHEARLVTLRKKAGGRCLWDPPVVEAG